MDMWLVGTCILSAFLFSGPVLLGLVYYAEQINVSNMWAKGHVLQILSYRPCGWRDMVKHEVLLLNSGLLCKGE